MLRFNFSGIVQRIKDTIPHYPLEVILSLFSGIFISLVMNNVIKSSLFIESSCYMCLSVAISYVANKWTSENNKSRAYYYLAGIVSAAALPVLGYYYSDIHYCIVAFVLAILVYFLSGADRTNNAIADRAVRFVKSVFISGVFMAIIFALLSIILLSVSFLLFEIDNTIYTYIYCITGSFFFTLFFIYYNNQECEYHSAFFKILINYILTISLLIYTLILYLYIAKIIFLWTLPKGQLAYITIMYISLFFMTRAVSSLMPKPFMPSFFRYAPFISLAPLFLLWIGAMVRILDYGLTIDRCYLLIVAVIESLIVLFSLSKKTENYLLMIAIAICLLFAGTYIPYINVKALSEYSQSKRPVDKEIKESDQISAIRIEADEKIDIAGYSNVQLLYHYPYEYKTDSLSFVFEKEQIKIKEKSKKEYEKKLIDIYKTRLAKIGYSDLKDPSPMIKNELLRVKQDPYLFVFNSITLKMNKDSLVSVSFSPPVLVFTK